MFRYYLTERGPSIGTQPNGTTYIQDFGDKKYIPAIGCKAWGLVEYGKPLTVKQIEEYELVEAKRWV